MATTTKKATTTRKATATASTTRKRRATTTTKAASPRKRAAAPRKKAAATTTKTHTRTPHKRAASTTRTQKTTTAMKRKTAPKSKPMDFFGSDEKEELLLLIGEIIHLHKLDPDGLKSLEAIERILDKYNQRYTKPTEKFDAIVKYGMSKDLKHADKHIYMFKNNLQPDTAHLYELLNAIGNHKVKFPEAREKMLDVYKEAPHRHKKFK